MFNVSSVVLDNSPKTYSALSHRTLVTVEYLRKLRHTRIHIA